MGPKWTAPSRNSSKYDARILIRFRIRLGSFPLQISSRHLLHQSRSPIASKWCGLPCESARELQPGCASVTPTLLHHSSYRALCRPSSPAPRLPLSPCEPSDRSSDFSRSGPGSSPERGRDTGEALPPRRGDRFRPPARQPRRDPANAPAQNTVRIVGAPLGRRSMALIATISAVPRTR